MNSKFRMPVAFGDKNTRRESRASGGVLGALEVRGMGAAARGERALVLRELRVQRLKRRELPVSAKENGKFWRPSVVKMCCLKKYDVLR